MTELTENTSASYSTRALPPESRRRYVTVETVTVHQPGSMSWDEPFAVRWPDGRRWEIERLYGHDTVGKEDGVEIVRWRAMIAGQPKYLFKARNWFVVPKTPKTRVP